MAQSLFEIGQYKAMKEASIMTVNELSNEYDNNIDDGVFNGLNNETVKELLLNSNELNIDWEDNIMGKALKQMSRKTTIYKILAGLFCLIGTPLLIIQNSLDSTTETVLIILLVLSIVFMVFGCFFCCYSLLLAQATADLALRVTDTKGEKCNVVRNAKVKLIDAQSLVSGDVVLLDQSFKCPADLRIIQCTDNFAIDMGVFMNLKALNKDNITQSVLKRDPKPIQNLNDNQNIFEISNLAWKHMTISEGKAFAVVVSIGSNTAYYRLQEFN